MNMQGKQFTIPCSIFIIILCLLKLFHGCIKSNKAVSRPPPPLCKIKTVTHSILFKCSTY